MIKCIAIDDEPLALRQMESYINKTPFLELCGKYSNALEVLETVNLDDIDLIFADIDMPDYSGLDFIKAIKGKAKVIFATAHSKYAIDGFKVDAVDYLLKPISYSDFINSANKAKKLCELEEASSSAEKPTEEGFIFIKSEHKFIKVNLSEILFVKGEREYVKIVFENKKSIMTLMNMKTVEEELPSSTFMRVHRSYIVNLFKIDKVDKNSIFYGNEHEVPISEQHKEKLLSFIEKHFL